MKKIILSLVTIALIGSAAVGATRAYFFDEVTSPENTFSTGTMTLLVNNQHPTATAVFNETALAPGSIIPERIFEVKNDGTINGHHLDLAVTLTGDTGLAKYIVFPQTVTNALRFGGAVAGTQSVRLDVPGYTAGDFEYGLFNGLDGSYFMGPANADNPKPTDATKNGMDLDGDGKVTLWDLSLAKIRITPGTVNAGINAGTTGSLWMNSIVDTTMGNDMQGKSVQATFTWTLHQDTTQF